MKFASFLLIISTILTAGCTKTSNTLAQSQNVSNNGYTYLALGDSYTIGQSVSKEESFPYQLAALLKKENKQVSELKIIAKTGWTTDELQSAIKSEGNLHTFDFVTLLIGVNNQFRNYSADVYRKEFIELLNTAVSYTNTKSKVFVVSIPDWGVTPFAAGYDSARIGKEIDAFNAINKEETVKAGIIYIDITPESRKAAKDVSLITSDGLHPSAKMYAFWAQQLLPKVSSQLK